VGEDGERVFAGHFEVDLKHVEAGWVCAGGGDVEFFFDYLGNRLGRGVWGRGLRGVVLLRGGGVREKGEEQGRE
jgi:hypothetical protein